MKKQPKIKTNKSSNEPLTLTKQEWKELKALPQAIEIFELDEKNPELLGKKYIYPKQQGKEVIMYTLQSEGPWCSFMLIKKIGGIWQLN
jgi:hypothetical protein